MRIPSGKTDQYIYFVAVDATDLKTRETGLTSFTVYRSRNGAAEVAYTTPTITEIDATNMPGVYALLIDEDTTIASTSDSEEYCVNITQASMAPVTRTIELYRRDTTSGQTATVASGIVSANVTQFGGSNGTFASGRPEVNTTHISGSAVSTSSAQIGVNVVNAAGTAWNSGAISANTLAADTLTAAKVAADVGTEIGTAVWATTTRLLTAGTNIVLAKGTGVTGFNDLDAAGVRTAVGLASANMDTQFSGIQSDTNDIQTRLPAALVGGRMDSSVGAMAANTLTASALATDAVTEIQAGLSTLDAAGVRSALGLASANLDTQLSTIDTVVDSILVDTAEIGAAGAGLTALASAANLATVDTVVDGIKAKTDSLTFTVAGQVDANTKSMNSATVNGNGTIGDFWRGA
jgi:hypothetical protein